MIIRPRVCKGKFFCKLFRLSSQFQLLFTPASSALSLHSSIRTLVQQGSAPLHDSTRSFLVAPFLCTVVFDSLLCLPGKSRARHRVQAKSAWLCCPMTGFCTHTPRVPVAQRLSNTVSSRHGRMPHTSQIYKMMKANHFGCGQKVPTENLACHLCDQVRAENIFSNI